MHKTLPVMLVPLAALALAACGSSSRPGATSTTTSTATTSSVATATPAAGDGATPEATTPAPDAPATSAAAGTTTAATGTATSGTGASSTATTSAGSTAAATGSSKRFATAKLPTTVDGYTGVVQKQGAGQTGQYTGASQDDMLMVQLQPIAATGALTRLGNAQVVGVAHCGGSSDAAGVMTCVVPLDGGSLVVQGTDTSTAAQVAKATNAIVAAFA